MRAIGLLVLLFGVLGVTYREWHGLMPFLHLSRLEMSVFGWLFIALGAMTLLVFRSRDST